MGRVLSLGRAWILRVVTIGCREVDRSCLWPVLSRAVGNQTSLHCALVSLLLLDWNSIWVFFRICEGSDYIAAGFEYLIFESFRSY